MRGQAVTGAALYEATNAMYRDWELIDVLATEIAYCGVGSEALRSVVEQAR